MEQKSNSHMLKSNNRLKHFALVAVFAACAGVSLPAKESGDRSSGAEIQSADAISKQIELVGSVVFPEASLRFKINSAELASVEGYRQVDEIARALQSKPLVKKIFTIDGHTCDLGPATYNMKLSERRALAIRDLLRNRGVSLDRMKVAAFGESRPLNGNENESQRSRNRRVEIKVINRM
jgi:OOP family OmpA-OmpF porin